MARSRDVHGWQGPQALTKSLAPLLLLLSCCLPLGLPALALLASTGDPGQNTRTSTPRAGLAAYYACAGPPLLANRSVGKAGRPYAAPGGVGGNQGRGVLGRGRGCGSCQVAATQALCSPTATCLENWFDKTWEIVALRPRGHVLLSWPRVR